MVYLVDTNVLLRFARRGQPLQAVIRAAVRKLWAGGHSLRTTPQNFEILERVHTTDCPERFGFSPTAADRRLRRLEWLFQLLPDSPAVYPEWRRLVVAHGVSGVQVHDARLVAFMLIHKVGPILTLNTADFARYAPEGVVAVDPQTV